MKSYICDNCGFINKIDQFNENTICINCKATNEKLRLIENEIAENEIDAIINSVIEEVSEDVEEKIINKDSDINYLVIDEDNPCLKKNNEKCIKCGQCKKTCEKFANLRYDLNKCLNPICIGCGECIKNCPSKAITQKEEYVKVKDIIDKNEKIVIAIVEPNVPLMIANHYKVNNENFDFKINSALKKLGFDYTFNSSFACDINVIEEVSEFIERLKNKKLLPLISTNCSSLTKYIEIYHPEIINNISSCKNALLIQSEIIKEVFCEEKGFNKDKIVTVGISSCISNKMKIKEKKYSLDYVLTINELIKMIDIEEINMNNLETREYDDYNNFSSSSKLIDLPGGQCENFIKTFCKLVSKTKKSVNEIDESIFMNVDGIKELNIKISEYELRVAMINSIYELDYLIDSGNYKKYHYIEVKMCKNGCIKANQDNIDLIKQEIYKNVNKYPFDNKDVKHLYNKVFSRPLSPKSIELFHETYNNKSQILTNL